MPTLSLSFEAAEAHTNRELAAILELSERTVENHRANAMRKLGMRDRVELVRYAIRRGLTRTDRGVGSRFITDHSARI